MVETKGDHVVRMGAQDRLPHADGAIDLALGPGAQRGNVSVLARGGAGGQRLCSARCLDRDRNDRLLEPEHGEIALHAMRQREVRIGLQHGLEAVGRIGALGEVAGDEMVEGSGSLGAGGREREAAGIEMHGRVLTDTTGLPDRFGHRGRIIRSPIDTGAVADGTSAAMRAQPPGGPLSSTTLPSGSQM